MKNLNIEEKGSLLLVGILIFSMIFIFGFTLLSKLYNKMDSFLFKSNNNLVEEKDNNIKSNTNIEKKDVYSNKAPNIIDRNLIKQYINAVDYTKDKLEKTFSTNMYKYEKLVEWSYFYNKLFNYNLYSNSDGSTIPLGNNYFSKIFDRKNLDEQINSLKDFSKYIENQNINFLYVQAPFKISNNENLSPIYRDYTNEMIDTFLQCIGDDVDYLDLREQMKIENGDSLNLFFKTDHHWLPETGLLATNIISEHLNNKYALNLQEENIKKDKFNYSTYKNIFLGSAGKKVSLANATTEDFTLITPKFDTKLHIKLEDLNMDNVGNFEETLINFEEFKNENLYKKNLYSSYMYGDRSLIEIQNLYNNNNRKILLIKDSFSEVISPFLSLENEYLSIIDLRLFSRNLKEYIKEYNPDCVIVLYNGSIISEDIKKSDIKSLWTFE